MTDLSRGLIMDLFGREMPEVPPVYNEAKKFYNPKLYQSDVIPYYMLSLYTEEQMRMLLIMPASAEKIAEELGLEPERVLGELDELVSDGKLLRTPSGYARIPTSVVLAMDFLYFAAEGKREKLTHRRLTQLRLMCSARIDKNDIKPEDNIRLPMRVIPKWRAIKSVPGVMPCEDMREIMLKNQAEGRLVSERCTCNVLTSMWEHGEYSAQGCGPLRLCEGQSCEEGHCYQMGLMGEYYKRFLGGYVPTREEALKKLEETENANVIYVASNTREVTNVCCCDFSYCVPRKMDAWEHVPSRFRPERMPDKCIQCRDCMRTCQFGAIDVKTLAIDADRCMGCGNCVTKCKERALRMKLVRPVDWIPEIVRSPI